MVKASKALVSALLMALVALSGCTEGGADPALADGVEGLEDGILDAGELTIDSEVQAPEWTVGQYYGHHIFFGNTDTTGTHINTVVVDDSGDSYTLLTDNREIAEFEATLDVPILGKMSKSDLSTTAFGGPWDMYDFPLRDGKTWTSEITADFDFLTLDPITSQADVTATFDEALPMPGSSKTFPGFRIVGLSGGETLFETDYIPAIGWYGSFRFYDLATEDPDDYVFFVRSMGYGDDFGSALGGVVYDIQGTLKVHHVEISVAPEGNTGGVHRETFDVSEAATNLVGVQFTFAAVAGQSTSQLIDPAGTNYGYVAVSQPNGADPFAWGDGDGTTGDGWEEWPVSAGEWQYIQENAGFVSGGGAIIWELVEQQIIL